MYSGQNCENKSAEKQQIENCITAASVIAIICMVGIYLIMLLSDVDTITRVLLRKNRTKKAPQKRKNPLVKSKKSPNETRMQKYGATKKTHLEYIPL
jgi:hypothetical protein